jgi:hypothetical protein
MSLSNRDEEEGELRESGLGQSRESGSDTIKNLYLLRQILTDFNSRFDKDSPTAFFFPLISSSTLISLSPQMLNKLFIPI